MKAVGRFSVNLIEHNAYIDCIVVFGSHLLANSVAAATLMPKSMKMLCANANLLLSSTRRHAFSDMRCASTWSHFHLDFATSNLPSGLHEPLR